MDDKIICNTVNGKIIIHGWVAIITFIVLVFTTFTSIVALTVNAQSDIQANSKDVLNCKEEIINAKEVIDSNSNRITKIETHYTHITEQLNRIEDKLEDK